MQITVETITPETAASILAKNLSNRPISGRHVDFLTAQIKGGYFLETGDSIKISKEGELIDGQHRLSAVVRSGVPIVCAIARDVDRSVFEVLDTGRARSSSDVLAVSGFRNANNLAAAARFILLHKAGLNSRAAQGDVSDAIQSDFQSNKKVLDFVEANADAIQEAVSFAAVAYKKCRFVATSEYAAYYYIFSEKSKEDARFFWEKFASGSNLDEKSPILLLRRALERNVTSHVKLTQYSKKYYIVRAWNAFREKRSLGVLQYNKDFKMPEIV